MSLEKLTNQISGIEQSLEELRISLDLLKATVAGIGVELDPLGDLPHKVSQLTKLEDAKIEVQLQQLSARIEALKRTRIKQPFGPKDLFKALLAYWTLIAFVLTGIIAAYVYYTYGVGYFETYKNIANTKQSANYYVGSGKILNSRAEFAAAESAFKTATEIDPHNIEARRGLMLSQVLKPGDGLRIDPPEVFAARMDYLEAEPAFKDDPLLPYFRGRLSALKDDRKSARTYFEESQKQIDRFNESHSQQPNKFVGNYIELGILDMYDGDIAQAIKTFNTEILAAANQTNALNHLAECYIITNQFDKANEVLLKLLRGSPRVESYLIFGDLLRYRFATDPVANQKDLEKATINDRLADDLLGSAGSPIGTTPPNGRNLVFGIDYGLMHFIPIPLINTPRFEEHSVVDIEKVGQYQALTNYAISLDYALAGNFTEADRYYTLALSTDELNRFRCVFVYKTRFYRSKLTNSPPGLTEWFDRKAEAFAGERCNWFLKVRSEKGPK